MTLTEWYYDFARTIHLARLTAKEGTPIEVWDRRGHPYYNDPMELSHLRQMKLRRFGSIQYKQHLNEPMIIQHMEMSGLREGGQIAGNWILLKRE